MTPDPASTLAKQKQNVEREKRVIDSLALKQKEILRSQIAEYDKQLRDTQAQRNQVAADLQALG